MDRTPQLLTVNTAVWQRALAVMRLCGVAHPAAVALNNFGMLYQDWLAPGRLANRLALQRCVGLSAAGVYERFGSYVATKGAERLAGRLLYLEQRGLLHLLVADKQAAKEAWRRQQGLPASKKATGEPAFISVGNVAVLPDADFICLLAKQPCSAAADFAAFKAGLLDSPTWLQLLADAQAASAQLNARLEPELRLGADAAAGDVQGLGTEGSVP